MEIAHLHQLIDEKKWTLIFREFDQLLATKETFEDNESLISIFESIDKNFREENAQKYYFEMWKVAFAAGKLKLARSYAEFILDYLTELKRVPAIKKLISELQEVRLFKSHKKFTKIDIILGVQGLSSLDESEDFEYHPELWKNSKAVFREFLLLNTNWKMDEWKLVYEFILKFYYDRDIFISLLESANKFKKNDHQNKFLAFFNAKKVKLENFDVKKIEDKIQIHEAALNIDYDQLAMDVMSGAIEPSITEQKKILVSIQELSDDELLSKGKDMVVAFGLLGMDKVVVKLCEKIIPMISAVDQRAGIQFMMAQSLFNSGNYYKAIEAVDDTFENEPLLPDEMIAFNYLKAESYLKLKKHKAAKELYLSIKKQNPHYRLVGERLRNIEEIK